jgi:hypothetical protein
MTEPETESGSPALEEASRELQAARHGRLWAQDGLTYFRASAVDWA